jgi:hypothetical protein
MLADAAPRDPRGTDSSRGSDPTRRNVAMATVLFTVRATISKEKEADFNHWYNTDHLPKVLRFNGAISGRRYKKLMGPDKYQYMAVYEFANEGAWEAFSKSDTLRQLRQEYDEAFGTTSERDGFAYVQVWP